MPFHDPQQQAKCWVEARAIACTFRHPGRLRLLDGEAGAGASHPRTGGPDDFLFVIAGRPWRSPNPRALDEAALGAGLVAGAGRPLHVTSNQLRHTDGTSLVHGGMSLQALMALLGTPEMTLRYVSLACETVRHAYEAPRPRCAPDIGGGALYAAGVPERVEWPHAEMLKTARRPRLLLEAPHWGCLLYANICELCEQLGPHTRVPTGAASSARRPDCASRRRRQARLGCGGR